MYTPIQKWLVYFWSGQALCELRRCRWDAFVSFFLGFLHKKSNTLLVFWGLSLSTAGHFPLNSLLLVSFISKLQHIYCVQTSLDCHYQNPEKKMMGHKLCPLGP